MTAIEIDPVLAEALPATVAARLPSAPLSVRASATRCGSRCRARPTALVANLPYNVAVPVVLHLLETVAVARSAGWCSCRPRWPTGWPPPPGSKVYGVPSVKVAWYAAATRAGAVARTVFWPAPNVDSGLVRLVRRPPPVTTASRAEVFAVIDAAFAQRRKMLRSALAGWAGSPAAAEAALRAAGIDPTARGETLDVPSSPGSPSTARPDCRR